MALKSSTIIGGAGIEKRRDLDFYPTPKEVTISLILFLMEKGLIENRQTIYEPACGDGAI